MMEQRSIKTPRADGAVLQAAFTVSDMVPEGSRCMACNEHVGCGKYHECWKMPTSEAQPGQEQRMVTDAIAKAAFTAGGAAVIAGVDPQEAWHDFERCIPELLAAARPSADRDLIARLRREDHMPTFTDRPTYALVNPDGPEAADRLILYREALEVLLLVKDAVDYRGDACHPAEMVGAVLDKCILERIDAVLSRSGG